VSVNLFSLSSVYFILYEHFAYSQGKTRALKPYKNMPLDLVWNEAFELRFYN
jgi:hypothetical protein